tara:strand:+ start:134 stop:307 length:174 start_codon:yes stop_codon:yes gene_type:complete
MALVLTRRIGEAFAMTDKETGKEIEVRVGGITGNQVKIVVEAPREINVVRNELINKK